VGAAVLRHGAGMIRKTLIAALVLGALTPATALAAKAPQGTFSGPLSGHEDASMSVTVDKGRIIALTFRWACSAAGADRLTTIVSNAAGVGGATIKVKNGRFSVERSARTTQGTVESPDFKEARGIAEATGRWKGRTVRGTFKTTAGGCSSSPLTFTARPA
jgi:hypothetical protein